MQRSRISSTAVVLTMLAAGLLHAAQKKTSGDPKTDPKKRPAVTSLPALPADLHAALQDQRHEAAIAIIDGLLKKSGVKGAGYLLYLKGRTQTELKQYDAALKTFESLEKRFPKSDWVARARFGRADVHVRQRDYKTAGQIYQDEAERLLSDKRQDELTGIYLEFADRYFDGVPVEGPGSEKKPDYTQALTYYQQALKLRSGKSRKHRIEFRIARCLQELKRYGEAIAHFQSFLKQYASENTKDEDRVEAKLEVEARYELGRSQLAAGQHAAARKTWQDFLKSDLAKKAGGDFVAQATYQLAKTYGVPTPPSVPNLELGVAALNEFLKKFPNNKLAAKAEFEIAQSYLHHGRLDDAVKQLKASIQQNTKRLLPLIKNRLDEEEQERFKAIEKQTADARRLLGETYFAQKKFDEAIAAFRDFLDKHPTDPQWSNVQRRVIDTEFAAAEEQRREKNYAAARKLWSTFLNKYPLDPRAPRILFAFGAMKYAEAAEKHRDRLKQSQEAGKKIDPQKLEPAEKTLFEEAITDWKRLVSKYPGTREASHGAYMIGVTLEDSLARLADALEAYKKVTGPYQSVAQARIAALTAKKLDVLTERKFRSNEKAVIKIRTRNLEKVTVKAYRIDMVDYFRKMHLAGGVETLDIALIDPDKSWEYKVNGFEKYRQLINDVEIPTDGPGVTAVTVSSEKLEATTMVIVSDLDIIVKASRNELFVFAQNMRTQKPADGVSLLISDGKEVFAEEVTGKDGILQKSYEKLKTVQDLRVFAIHEGHAASTVSNLEGLKFAVGLAAKGYLYTDRPAYRAGELVHLKGIVRWVNDDTYTFKEGEKYKLDVYDSRGRVIHTKEIALGKFGTFADRLMLPSTAPQGNYRVHLHQPGKTQSYETIFSVHEIKLEPIQLVVDLPKKVYFRGEKIEGKVVLKYYYGTPLADRTIRYQLSNGRVQTATTNGKGEVAFSFETTQYNESQQLAISASYPERNIGASAPVFLATRGFAVNVSTRRNVFIAGETFDAKVTVTDPAGKPLATELKLEVFELLTSSEARKLGNKRGEKRISTHELKTDTKTGEVSYTLRIDKAGFYRLRATGTDQFGNPVSGQHVVRISGDDDHIRLRILADKHNFKVGDTAKVQLHWREAPALALVTFDGAKVLGYRLVQLKKGANALALPMEAKLAPNFVLSVTVMEKNKFHQARSEFLVSRKLTIKLKARGPRPAGYRPGDEVTVEVTTTDPHGKPVSAELSLGLIQKNLLDRFSDQQQEISAFFSGGYRQPSVRAFTSATFRYRPHTRGINKYLLAEQERHQILQQELKVRKQLAQAERIQELEKQAVVDANKRVLAGELPPSGKVGLDFVGGYRVREWADRANDSFEEAEEVARKAVDLWSQSHIAGQTLPSGYYLRNNIQYFPKDKVSIHGPLGGQQRPNAPGADNGKQQAGGFGALQLDPQKEKDADGQLKALVEKHRSGKWHQLDGVGGTMSEFDTKLSLVIKQSEKVQDNPLLKDIANITDGTIVALAQNGEYQVVNGIPIKRLEALAKQGMRVLPGMAAAETGYWNPMVVTGKNGKSVVKFRLPNRSTAWKLRAKGTDAGILTGQAEAEIIARKDLFGEIRTPLAFYQGDKATVLVEVHNAKLKKGTKIDVALQTTIGNRVTKLKKTITSAGPGIAEVTFPLEVTEGETAEFQLTVTAGKETDSSIAAVPVRPFGMPVFATASGSAVQNTIAFVEHDKKLDVQNPTMEIVIGPSINRTLLDAVMGGGLTRCESSFVINGTGIERNVSDVIGGVAVLKMIRGSRNTDTPEADALSARIQSAVTSLVSSQRNDGGWSWNGRPNAGGSDRLLTSRVVWALSASRDAGFAVPDGTYNKAVQWLRSAFSAANRNDLETQAILLHGLSHAKSADFALVNRLYRERNRLQTSGLLHLALTLIQMDRKQMADDLLALVKLPADKPSLQKRYLDSAIPWMRSGVELRALYLLALQATKPGDKLVQQLADWLLAARRGSRWFPEKANGPAIAALAEYFSRAKFQSEKYTLEVVVNGGLVEKLTLDPAKDGSRRLQVPAKLLVKGQGKQQKINFNLTGRGRFSYSVVFSGFVPAEKLKSTTDDWSVARYYEPDQLLFDGKPVPRGFGILTSADRTKKFFRNPLTQLPLGVQGEVTVQVRRNGIRREGDREFLVLTEPIPSGCSVVADSVTGSFERFEIAPGAIRFYIGDEANVGNIRYTLVGYLPGQYKAAPSLLRSFYHPDRIVVTGIKPLDVLSRGAKSKDKYKLTPVELFELGKRLIAKRQYKEANTHLTNLFRKYGLRGSTFGEVVKLLFRTSLEVKNGPAIVEFFEIIKERYPSEVFDFDEILQVAAAYRKLGEYERGYLVFRSTIEAAFQRESRIAGFLDDRGEFLRSVQVMEKLLANYPAESYIATATYSLAQEVYGKASEVAQNKKLRDAGLTKAGLIAANIRMLDHFLSTWPKDPAVDQAAFSMANSYLDLENYEGAIRRCEKFAERYPKSKLLDSYWYVIGYSQFALGRHDDALKMVRKVAEATHKDPKTGVEVAAANKWQAVYIMGQIYHSLGKPKQAIDEYKRVKNRFPDAAQSIDFFTRKEIKLPEVTTVKPGEAAKATLKFRNVAEANVKVYRIDLLKFGLMQRNLNRITAINLAGIRPYHEMTLKLGDGLDFRDRKTELKLPLKDEGAYLVVCRGASLYASGLVLISPLSLEIQEDAVSGRVRVTVRNAAADKYAKDVDVKVIGSANAKFVSGETDLRGVFIADAIRGTSTVIAKADKNRYAFYRGKTTLGNVPKTPKPGKSARTGSKSGQGQTGKKGDLLKNLREQNSKFNNDQRRMYKDLLQNKSKGVEAQKAFQN